MREKVGGGAQRVWEPGQGNGSHWTEVNGPEACDVLSGKTALAPELRTDGRAAWGRQAAPGNSLQGPVSAGGSWGGERQWDSEYIFGNETSDVLIGWMWVMGAAGIS